jgi:hypothetical protein
MLTWAQQRRSSFGGCDTLGRPNDRAKEAALCGQRTLPAAAGTDDALVAVAIGGTERGELVADQLGEAGVVRRHLVWCRSPLERPEVQECLGGGRTKQPAVGGDGPLEGAVAAPVARVQVHHEVGSDSPQWRGEGQLIPAAAMKAQAHVRNGPIQGSSLSSASESAGCASGTVLSGRRLDPKGRSALSAASSRSRSEPCLCPASWGT